MTHLTDHAKELWRVQASANVDCHETLCAIDGIVSDNIKQEL